jgi:hypothetical protein
VGTVILVTLLLVAAVVGLMVFNHTLHDGAERDRGEAFFYEDVRWRRATVRRQQTLLLCALLFVLAVALTRL